MLFEGPYKYSSKSLGILDTCDPQIRKVFLEVIKHVDCTIICGHRTEGEQNLAFTTGVSKVRWPYSKHNKKPSRAIDALPYVNGRMVNGDYPGDWEIIESFARFVQGVGAGLGIKLRWGADWNNNLRRSDENFKDGPHYELVED